MTKTEIITKAQLYLDDMSELSTQEFSDLFDKIYQKVCDDRPWEFTKTSYSGTTSTSVDYVALPSDFAYLTQNHNYTDSGYEAERPVVFVGSQYSPYYVVSWSDRRQYRNADGYVYLDIPNSRLYFTKQPTSALAIEYDYHATQAALASGDTPAFPSRFHDILYHGMCVEDYIIQQSDKARSYAQENVQLYNDYLDRMAYWNAQLIQM